MKLQATLRECLNRARGPLPTAPELASYRKHLLDALDHRGEDESPREKFWTVAIEHEKWSVLLEPFIIAMKDSLRQGFASEATTEEIENLLAMAVRRAVGASTKSGSMATDMELDRLIRLVTTRDPLVRFGQNIHDYAIKIGALSIRNNDRRVSPIGRLILDLPDHEVTRWLLHVEAVTSLGPEDPWRLSREGANALVEQERHVFLGDGSEGPWPVTWETIHRLSTMGILYSSDNKKKKTTELSLLPLGRDLLREVARPTSSFSQLAEAMTRDDVTTTLNRLHGATDRMEREGAREAANRWARMVAHEIRNALVPAQGAWDMLREDLSATEASTTVERYGGAITQGLSRVFRFVEEASNIAALSADPPAPFDVIRAIHDAALDLSGSIHVAPQGTLPTLTGHRSRFSLAMRNLLENALQAGAKNITVGARNIEGAGALEITVDDDGPGVPRELRSAIFDPGFSTRPEGTGHGLSFVRDVVERELGGRITCQSNDLGGAQFMVRLPIARGEDR